MLNRESKEPMEAFEVCHKGMKSLFDNYPTNNFFNKSVLNDVKEVKFEVEKIGLIKMLGEYDCDVVVKDHLGHRSYRVKLEKNSKFPHLYQIVDVKGQKIVSSYQWRDEL